MKGAHRSQHEAADSPAEGGVQNGDSRVGKASELERSHGDSSSGSSASLLGCNFLHHPKSSQRTVAHQCLEEQPGKGQAHRLLQAVSELGLQDREQPGGRWDCGVGWRTETIPQDWEPGLRGDPGNLFRGPHSVWALAG